jgi:hypothetical protein
MTALVSLEPTVLDEIGFLGWLGQARPGDVLTYHHGFLALDVGPATSRLSPPARDRLGLTARCAWRAAERGLVHLLQRRHGPDAFSYLAIARARPEPLAMPVTELLMEAA